jgi:hypothetical protein
VVANSCKARVFKPARSQAEAWAEARQRVKTD